METFVVALISAQVLASRQKLHEHAKDYTIIAQKHRGVPYVTKGNQPNHSRLLFEYWVNCCFVLHRHYYLPQSPSLERKRPKDSSFINNFISILFIFIQWYQFTTSNLKKNCDKTHLKSILAVLIQQNTRSGQQL